MTARNVYTSSFLSRISFWEVYEKIAQKFEIKYRSYFYMHPHISIRGFVRPSVRWFATPVLKLHFPVVFIHGEIQYWIKQLNHMFWEASLTIMSEVQAVYSSIRLSMYQNIFSAKVTLSSDKIRPHRCLIGLDYVAISIISDLQGFPQKLTRPSRPSMRPECPWMNQ